MLITGPWDELSGRYSCVFDQSTVAASLIQPGVLRCYCPGIHTLTASHITFNKLSMDVEHDSVHVCLRF